MIQKGFARSPGEPFTTRFRTRHPKPPSAVLSNFRTHQTVGKRWPVRPGGPTITLSNNRTALRAGFFTNHPTFDIDTSTSGRTPASGGTGSGARNPKRNSASPDVETVRRLSRKRFFDSFKRRWKAHSKAEKPRGRKRKRTAMALGISALGLTGASNLALHAGPGLAQSHTASEAVRGDEFADTSERRSAEDLSASDDLIEAIIDDEGVRYDVYRDMAGHPTVGVGHFVLPEDNLRIGDTISHERAMTLLEQDLAKAEDVVRRLLGELPVSQHEFDALVDLVFNVGEGTVSQSSSPRLNEAIAIGDYEGMADELHYATAGNRVAKGLILRSERRAQIFMNGEYGDPREA